MLLRALLVSLLSHLALLASWRLQAERPMLPGGVVQATLLARPANSRAVASVGAVPPMARPADLAGEKSKARPPRRKGAALQSSQAASGVLAPISLSERGSRSAPNAQSSSVGGEALAVLPEAVERAAVAVDSSVATADALRQYRLALAREARRYKRYPALARERGWQGTVTVAIEVAPPGAPPRLSIGQSSGNEYLDALAREMVAHALLTADVPNGLQGRAFAIDVPVRYVLEE